MNKNSYFKEEQSKLFSLLGRSKSDFHFTCLSLINNECRDNSGNIMKEVIIQKIESINKGCNATAEILLLEAAGYIELFQKPHIISDFVRMTKDGRILYNAIIQMIEEKKDFSYGKFISDIYRRLSTIQEGFSSTYQDILLPSVEDVRTLKEYMQVFKCSFEDFVKAQRANVKNAEDIIKIMQTVCEGKEFKNYKAIAKDKFNYFMYSSKICENIKKIRENKDVLDKLALSASAYECISLTESEELIASILYEINMFFMDEYKEYVNDMKESENECYQKIANTLTLYAADGTEDKSICDLILQIVHAEQEGELTLSDDFYWCFDLFDNNLFSDESFRDKRKDVEYKTEAEPSLKELDMIDKINILIVANEKMKMKASSSEIEAYLEKEMKEKETFSSEELTIKNEYEYARVFLILSNCANQEFAFEISEISDKAIDKGAFKIPLFKIKRREA